MKMLFVLVFFFSLFIVHSFCYITIEIEPDDICQINDILQSIINQNQHHVQLQNQRKTFIRAFIPMLKTFTVSILQMIEITITLVSSNLITTQMEPIILHKQIVINNSSNVETKTISQQENICKQNNYGCNANICWRTCNEKDADNLHQKGQTICFTSASVDKNEHQTCKNNSDCSPCWNCITSCQAVLG